MNRLLDIIQKKTGDRLDLQQLEKLSDQELENIIEKMYTICTKYDDRDYLIMKSLYLEQFRTSSIVEVKVLHHHIWQGKLYVVFEVSVLPHNISFEFPYTFAFTSKGMYIYDSRQDDWHGVYLRDQKYPFTLTSRKAGRSKLPLNVVSPDLKKILKTEKGTINVEKYIQQLDSERYEYESDEDECERYEYDSDEDESEDEEHARRRTK